MLKMVVKFSMDPETSVDFLTRKQEGRVSRWKEHREQRDRWEAQEVTAG